MSDAECIETLYRAMQRRDGAAMARCYTADARFRDPVFELQGEAVGAMWQMLCERGKDLRVEFAKVQAGNSRGSADWQAWYSFSKTGRAVHNIIHAEFVFRDGRICEHVDSFSFWRWSRQALGPAGLVLGWTPLLRNKVRAEAARGLALWREKHGAA